MPTLTDPVFVNMAAELYQQLCAWGLDHKNPPSSPIPAAAAASVFAEYQRRGGESYTNPTDFVNALVMRVASL